MTLGENICIYLLPSTVLGAGWCSDGKVSPGLCVLRACISVKKTDDKQSFLKLKNFFLIYSCAGSLLLCVGFLQSWHSGSSLQWLLLWSAGSRVLRLSSCGTWAQLPQGLWVLPDPGVKPTSSALAGGFLTTGPPGKSNTVSLNSLWILYLSPWTC